ncbi:hypothetical protein BS47DRAFT_1386636 [Hydnum rufescens UP504]|uniref:DRBM domain-containing protein n=1 Tax=Hydnum rufescens UP504 TaxID=1448309 RepID=A0A9P6DDA3_9AGAM|nr:hypothetical protein BS47DRAFT_1386636 [Hydnum rufescens UP504]
MSSSNAAVISAGGHVRALHNFLHGSKRELTWTEEVVEVSQPEKCTLWHVTAVVDGEPLGSGSGPRLKTAKARAAEITRREFEYSKLTRYDQADLIATDRTHSGIVSDPRIS